MSAKVIQIANKENALILGAKRKDRLAQKALYDLYAAKMLSVCHYYIPDLHFAEDVMIKGFYKAFTKIEYFEGNSSFYTWLKRIISNECIDFLRSKHHKFNYAEWNDSLESIADDDTDLHAVKELENLIEFLPDGCRMVFNLYVMEDMKHNEIAEKLNISVGTSKSQLSYARKFLKEQLKLKKNV